MGSYFESGKAKAAKGEGLIPPLIGCAQFIVGLKPRLLLQLLGYGKSLSFYTTLVI